MAKSFPLHSFLRVQSAELRVSCRAVSWCRRKKQTNFCVKKSTGRGWHPRHPAVAHENNEIKPLYVILSEVEVSPSEERGETKAPRRRRDLVWNFGVFLHRCNIHNKSHPNSFGDPIVANAPRFCLFASLNPQNFDFAKRKRFSPLRMTNRVIIWWYAFVFFWTVEDAGPYK